jgi:hypothetical protein
MAMALPPSFFMALATLIPPPPGSKTGGEHLSFFSGISAITDVLLSMHGLKVIVQICAIEQFFKIKICRIYSSAISARQILSDDWF